MSASSMSPNGDFRILLVDDNEDANESMCSLLSMLGYDVRAARDGASGLEAAAAFSPHLVLCDIGLPDISGYQLAPAIRRVAGERELVLAAATGYGFPGDMMQVCEAGFDFHFVPAGCRHAGRLRRQPVRPCDAGAQDESDRLMRRRPCWVFHHCDQKNGRTQRRVWPPLGKRRTRRQSKKILPHSGQDFFAFDGGKCWFRTSDLSRVRRSLYP